MYFVLKKVNLRLFLLKIQKLYFRFKTNDIIEATIEH